MYFLDASRRVEKPFTNGDEFLLMPITRNVETITPLIRPVAPFPPQVPTHAPPVASCALLLAPCAPQLPPHTEPAAPRAPQVSPHVRPVPQRVRRTTRNARPALDDCCCHRRRLILVVTSIIAITFFLVVTKLAFSKDVVHRKAEFISITPLNKQHLNFLQQLRNSSKDLFWSESDAVNKSTLLEIDPSSLLSLTNQLDNNGIPREYYFTLRQALKTQEKASSPQEPSTTSSIPLQRDKYQTLQYKPKLGETVLLPPIPQRPLTAIARVLLHRNEYHTLEQIYHYLKLVESTNHGLATVIEIGTTDLGSSIRALKFSSGFSRKAVLIDAGIRASDWISPSTALNIIDTIVRGYKTNDKIKSILNTYDLYVIPCLNPDGYMFTHKSDRTWSKNRKRHKTNFRCIGVNVNRNFDSFFGGTKSSKHPCDSNYAGEMAFSERESSAIRDLVFKLGSKLKVYMTMHAFGQRWLIPYGYTTHTTAHHEQLMEASRIAVKAIRDTHGLNYKIGQLSYGVEGIISGVSSDWVHAKGGIKHTYTIGLRDNVEKRVGFPPVHLNPIAEEIWEGIQALLLHIKYE